MGIVKLKVKETDRHLRMKTETAAAKGESKHFAKHFQVKEHGVNSLLNIGEDKDKKQMDLFIKNFKGFVPVDQ
jgi:5-enolpyruvylshikimate-3-phosphate synthase